MPFPYADGALVTLHDDMSAEGAEPLLCCLQIGDVIFEREGEKADPFNPKFIHERLNLKCDHESGSFVCAGKDVELVIFLLGAVVTR